MMRPRKRFSLRFSEGLPEGEDHLSLALFERFGTGTGASSAMEQLIGHLKHHHADVAKCIVGSVAVDEHHLTEGQLLARAREFYGALHESQRTAR